MLNVVELNPCPTCGKCNQMVLPGKGDTWYIACGWRSCRRSTSAFEDIEDARAEWDNPDSVATPPAKPKPKKIVPGKKVSNSALMRERIGELDNPTEHIDQLVEYGIELGLKPGSAKSCVIGNLKKMGYL